MMKTHPKLWIGACAALVALFALGACSGAQKKIDSKPMPAGVSFTGEWYSPNYEKMTLIQTGNAVKGTFSYKDGGTLEGTLEGNVLYFTWVQVGDFNKAVRDVKGSGYFVIADDGNAFSGRWGYNEDNHSGGVWDGERVDARKPEEGFDKPIFGN